MDSVYIHSFNEYLDAIKKYSDLLEDDEELFYRGVSDCSYDLRPGILFEKSCKEDEAYHSLILEYPEEFNTNAEENVPANEPNIPDAQSLVANAVREKMAVMQNENDDFETEGFIDMTPPESDEMKTIENTPSNKKATSPISTKDDMYIKATERLKELSKIESEKMLNLIRNNNKTL